MKVFFHGNQFATILNLLRKDYEIEQILKGRIYKRKIYFNNELRYQILGKAFGRLIMVIVVPIGTTKIKVFSARPAPEYKEIYDDKAK